MSGAADCARYFIIGTGGAECRRVAAPNAPANWRTQLAERNATAAVVGAGDFIGAAIAKKFAAEGFTIFAGRRNADKLAPLVGDIEAAGGKVVARGLDARKE